MKTFPRRLRRLLLPATLFTLAVLQVGGPQTVCAQGTLGNLVATLGTVATDANNQNWAYILWQPLAPGLLSNQVFAVYAKPGGPISTNLYARQSLIQMQTDARVIEPLIRRAASLGDDTNKLQSDVQALFAALMPAGTISLANQISVILRGSLSTSQDYQNLMLLARNHPAIDLALGFADAELIGPGTTTFEVRAWDPKAQQDLAVIGRVTVQSGAPTVLPAPGPPVLVSESSPMGDLNLKFRWATPDSLRLLSLMQYGFDLYRVASAFATNAGWNETNLPPLAMLTNLAASPATYSGVVKRVNGAPIIPSVLFEAADATNFTATGDTHTSYVMDDDGRGAPDYINYGFTNGAQFYYYVAARDVLGRNGDLSPGLLVTVCGRMPPYPPNGIQVLNEYHFLGQTASGLQTTQQLRVVWNQNTQTNDTVLNYFVYRWTNSTEMNDLQGDVNQGLIGVVSNVPGAVTNSFLDSGPGSPSALGNYGQVYWYTVRAADNGACGANVSFPGGPAFGVLRWRNGPAAPSGSILINCFQPNLASQGSSLLALPVTPDTNNYDVLLNCSPSGSRFDWAEFYGIVTYYSGGSPVTVSNFLGRFYFPASGAVSAWWRPPRTNQQYRVSMQVGCRAALSTGQITAFTTASVAPPDFAFYANVQFAAQGEGFHIVAGDTNNPACQMHDAGGGLGNLAGTNNILVLVNPTPGSAEYRVYRRVDTGPLTLLAQGAVTNTSLTITNYEMNPPLNGGTICLYAQLLDQNGNPSAMTPLGCVDCTPATTPPVPVLARITHTGDQNGPGMTLSWFCPPYGIERFEVRIAGLPTPPDTNNFDLSTQLDSTGVSNPMVVTNQGMPLTLPFYSFLTPQVGPAFGNNGAQFSVPCNIELGKTYFVTVRALLKNNYPGVFSGTANFLWTPTNATPLQVPWPALGLPATNNGFPTLNASFLSPTNSQSSPTNTGVFTGNGVLIGTSALGSGVSVNIAGNPPYVTTLLNPVSVLLTNTLGNDLFPCVLYRYQVPNANFPVTSGNVIQVSPLMETIAYSTTNQTVVSTNPEPANLVWVGDGVTNEWDVNTSTNWINSGTGLPTVFHQGDNVTFGPGGSSSPPVNIVTSVQPGSVTVTADGNYTFAGEGSISGAASLTKSGSGTLTLAGYYNYSGATVVDGGTLAVIGLVAGGSVVVSNGVLGGTGEILVPVTVQSSGILQPGLGGATISTLTISNTLNLSGVASMVIKTTNSPNASRVMGLTTVTYGGSLVVTNLGPIPATNTTFTLFTAASYTGSFGSTILPALPPGWGWNQSALAQSGTISVIPINDTIAPAALSPAIPDSSSLNGVYNPPTPGIPSPMTATNTSATYIYDPFVTITTDASGNLYLWLLDTQPVISGATYQYILVRFKPNHEIDQLIPSSLVTVP